MNVLQLEEIAKKYFSKYQVNYVYAREADNIITIGARTDIKLRIGNSEVTLKTLGTRKMTSLELMKITEAEVEAKLKDLLIEIHAPVEKCKKALES